MRLKSSLGSKAQSSWNVQILGDTDTIWAVSSSTDLAASLALARSVRASHGFTSFSCWKYALVLVQQLSFLWDILGRDRGRSPYHLSRPFGSFGLPKPLSPCRPHPTLVMPQVRSFRWWNQILSRRPLRWRWRSTRMRTKKTPPKSQLNLSLVLEKLKIFVKIQLANALDSWSGRVFSGDIFLRDQRHGEMMGLFSTWIRSRTRAVTNSDFDKAV